ncbi:GerAB/ArcD/ProY family transporter [Bacillus sp. 2205SS5-2]|uniref:GerAB/ArcD/ProY family transporter n=1 Tax=Bacillus sp. 2205SS5-2 TaxID=3109031 RepID=UPI003007DF14
MVNISQDKQISPYIVFFLINSIQVGIGVLGFQRVVAEKAGYDGWISVLLAGLSTHLVVIVLFQLAKTGGGDLVEVHRYVFGKWLGHALSLIFCLYLSLIALNILRNYIEVIQVWLFPKLNPLFFSFLFLVLVYYIVSSGFRVVTGVAFFGVMLPAYLALTFLYTLGYSDFRNFLPIWDHDLMSILSSAMKMSLTYLGYETLLIYYPFIKNGRISQKWAHLSLATTTLFYLFLTIITFAYFSEEQLKKVVWATLSLWKIVEMPFVERFEYIGIANWCLVILPNVCLFIWCASRIIKRTTGFRQRRALIVILCLIFVSVYFIQTREQINRLNDIAGNIGLYINYVYFPLLLGLLLLVKKVKK